MVYPYNGIVGNSEKERGSNMCSKKKKKKSQKYNKGKRQVVICIISTILVLK